MSRSVDLFVDHGDDPHQLLIMLGSCAHGPAVATTDGRWQVRFGEELIAHVYRHPYVDDGELRLSRYRWVVSIRVGHEGSLVDHPATTALRMVADDLRSNRCRVLLVLDLQYRLLLGPDPVGTTADHADDGDDGAAGAAGGPEVPELSGTEL